MFVFVSANNRHTKYRHTKTATQKQPHKNRHTKAVTPNAATQKQPLEKTAKLNTKFPKMQ